ncbi:MAG: hypothetical protein PWQ82_290 [Thermosediminibacterales bacterium]|nr:hypothetical protein [Thermosediminibacterales bacterium]
MDKYVLGMSVIRFLSAALELTAALLFLKLNDLNWALRINSFLGLVGPLIFAGVGILGIYGLAEQEISIHKILTIFVGVVIVLIGTLK